MMQDLRLSAIVLAGGQSSRMGWDKQLLSFDGNWNMEVLRDCLKPWMDALWIITEKPELYRNSYFYGIEGGMVSDEIPEGGPVMGLITGLRVMDPGWGLLLPCDLSPNGMAMLKCQLEQWQLKTRLMSEKGPYNRLMEHLVPGQEPPLPGLFHSDSLSVLENASWGGNCEPAYWGRSLREVAALLKNRAGHDMESANWRLESLNDASALKAAGGMFLDNLYLTKK